MNLEEFKAHASAQVQQMKDRAAMSKEPCKYYTDGVHLYYWNTSLWAKDIKYEQCPCGATGKIVSNNEE